MQNEEEHMQNQQMNQLTSVVVDWRHDINEKQRNNMKQNVFLLLRNACPSIDKLTLDKYTARIIRGRWVHSLNVEEFVTGVMRDVKRYANKLGHNADKQQQQQQHQDNTKSMVIPSDQFMDMQQELHNMKAHIFGLEQILRTKLQNEEQQLDLISAMKTELNELREYIKGTTLGLCKIKSEKEERKRMRDNADSLSSPFKKIKLENVEYDINI